MDVLVIILHSPKHDCKSLYMTCYYNVPNLVVRYTELIVSAVNTVSLGRYLPLPLENLLRKYFRRESEQ